MPLDPSGSFSALDLIIIVMLLMFFVLIILFMFGVTAFSRGGH